MTLNLTDDALIFTKYILGLTFKTYSIFPTTNGFKISKYHITHTDYKKFTYVKKK